MTHISPPHPDVALRFVMVEGWAPLGRVAVAADGLDAVTVLHGCAVETFPTWCAEAVWDGAFAEGGIDRTDLIAGTGLRARGKELWFVSSGDTLNRLQWLQAGATTIVSNSLPALLAVAGADLIDGYAYAEAACSIAQGLESYQREIPSMRGPIHLVCFNNLVLRGGELVEVSKPSATPDFTNFAAYRDYLFDAARRVGNNARSPERRHHASLMATMSSGYDSNAVAVVAREAGTRDAVTIGRARRDASNLFSLDDSGAGVAAQLGLRCRNGERNRPEYAFEDAAWAATGNVGELHLGIFDYPKPVCVLFQGFMGDTTWGMDEHLEEPFRRATPAAAGARFSEMRLELGVIGCSPVYWGCSKESQIRRLSHLPEMKPWTVGGQYDRPIPRRLLEEAGVKRGTFATRKRVSSFNRRYAEPLSVSLRADFARFLERRGLRPGTRRGERILLLRNFADWVLFRRLPARLRLLPAEAGGLPSPTTFFLWAIERCTRRYRDALGLLLHELPGSVRQETHPRT